MCVRLCAARMCLVSRSGIRRHHRLVPANSTVTSLYIVVDIVRLVPIAPHHVSLHSGGRIYHANILSQNCYLPVPSSIHCCCSVAQQCLCLFLYMYECVCVSATIITQFSYEYTKNIRVCSSFKLVEFMPFTHQLRHRMRGVGGAKAQSQTKLSHIIPVGASASAKAAASSNEQRNCIYYMLLLALPFPIISLALFLWAAATAADSIICDCHHFHQSAFVDDFFLSCVYVRQQTK